MTLAEKIKKLEELDAKRTRPEHGWEVDCHDPRDNLQIYHDDYPNKGSEGLGALVYEADTRFAAEAPHMLQIIRQQAKVIAISVAALKTIKEHQGSLIKGMPHLSSTYRIAHNALEALAALDGNHNEDMLDMVKTALDGEA